MRYAVPVNEAREVPLLANAGAAELYCGYQDDWWVERYGDHDSASRRQGAANFATLDDLERCAKQATACDLPLWLALNARYTEPQLDHLVGLCRRFEEMGGTGVIVSDLGLLWRLHGTTKLRRCLSILAVVQNRPTLEAYRRLGVSRVVLPRFLGPQGASALLSGIHDMEAESMAFFDKCPWVDGYCRHRHGISYQSRGVQGDTDDAPPLYTFDTTYQTHACLGRACTYLEPYPCAACHLDQFAQAGVGFAKLGGRGRPLDERLRALRFLVAAESLDSDGRRKHLYQQTFGQPCACYYGSAIQDHQAIGPVEDPVMEPGTVALGSQRDLSAYRAALTSLREGNVAQEETLALLVPPLTDATLSELLDTLPELCRRYGECLHVYVNDLGTLVSAAQRLSTVDHPCIVGAGTLLARSDDPREVAHCLSSEENPSRPIWGPRGEPRVLVYQQPPEELIEHWKRPSFLEPSAQMAFRKLVQGKPLDASVRRA